MTSQKSRPAPAVRTRVAGLALITLALIAGGYWYYCGETERIRQEKYQAIAAVGKLKSDQIERWRKERQRDADRLAHSSFTRKAVGDFLRQPDDAKLRADLREHLQVEREAGGNEDVLLLAPDGAILLATRDDSHPTSPALQRAIAAALAPWGKTSGPPQRNGVTYPTGRASPEAVISDFHRGHQGDIHIDVVAAVREAGGQPLAVVVLRRDPKNYLYPLIQSWPTPNRSAETILAQQEGAEVVFVNELRHATNAVLTLRFPMTRTNLPAVQAALGKRGQYEGKDYREVAVLADLRPIPGSPWFLVTEVDVAEILAAARYGAGQISLVVGSLILLAASLTAYVHRRRQAGLFQGLYESERRQRENESAFRTTLYSIGDAVITTGTDGRVREMNPVAEKLTGWSEAEARGQPLAEIFRVINETTRAAMENPVDKVLREGAVVGWGNHTRLIARDGTERPIAASGAPIHDEPRGVAPGSATPAPSRITPRSERGTVTGVVLVFRDQTALQAAQQTLRKSNRTLHLLSDCNRVLVRATDENDLLREICRIVKEGGGYLAAWVGFAEDDADQSVRIVAEVGAPPGFVAALKISWADTPRGRGPTGIAIRTGKPCTSQNVNSDPALEPWRNLVAQVGHHLVCALPLLASGAEPPARSADGRASGPEHPPTARRAFGTLTVYSAEHEVFPADEITLLQELADDLAFGILTLRARVAHLRAEAALRESRARLEEAQRLARVGSWEWEAETDTPTWSKELCAILEVDPTKPVPKLSEQHKLYTAESMQRMNSAVAMAMQTGTPYEIELERVREDNTRRWLLAHGECWFDEKQCLRGLRGTALDITERKQSEAALRLKSAALEAAANAIVITDRAGVIEWANAAFTTYTGYSAAEVIGQNPKLLKSGKHDAAFYRALWETVRAGEVWQGELINRRKDGSLYPEDMTITPLKDERGAITHFIAVKQDITKRKTLEEQYHQAQKMEAFGQLAGGVAHDFNNMLAVIMGNTSLLQMGLSEDDQQRVVQEIARAAERAANLTRQLLTFSRRQTMQVKVMDLNDVVSGMIKMLHRIIGEDIALQTRLLTGGAPMNGDPGMIEQVLLNLAVNARDAMPAGGQIALELANVTVDEAVAARPQVRPGNFVRLSFHDTGSGIAPELLPRIFEPFFTTKDVGKGTGLGLATVHGIVEQHHGWIEVESQPGNGTTFHIHLPRLADQGQIQAATQLAVQVRGGHETILLVEDDPSVRVLVVHALERYGYRVIEADSGVAALGIWRQQGGAVDLLLTDMVMPEGVSGRQLAEQLRVEKPGLKVIYMSGYPRETAGHGLKLREGVNFLQKPCAILKLAQTVRDCLDAPREREA